MFLFPEPENENFIEVITEMRKKIGWKTEIPRHGPGCKTKMDTLQDKPDTDEDEEVCYG